MFDWLLPVGQALESFGTWAIREWQLFVALLLALFGGISYLVFRKPESEIDIKKKAEKKKTKK